MGKLRTTLCFSAFILFVMSSCSVNAVSSHTSLSQDSLLEQDLSSVFAISDQNRFEKKYLYDSSGEVENARVVEEAEYYKLVLIENAYFYYIYDENYKIAKSEGPLYRPPRISMVDDYIVRVSKSAGPQKATTSSYYYNVKMDVFSRVFYAIHDHNNGRVAYNASYNMVVVRDIFDKTKYYQEFTNFKEPLAGPEPIQDVEFVNDGASIAITYLTGVDFRRVTEVFDLP